MKDKLKVMNKGEGNRYLETLTVAITLLAGISAVLLKLGEYFSNNIISQNHLYPIYFLTFLLIFELALLLLFLLIEGCLIWAEKNSRKLLEDIGDILGTIIFTVPLIIYFFLVIAFTALMFIGDSELSKNINFIVYFLIAVISLRIILYIIEMGNINREWVSEVVKAVKLVYFIGTVFIIIFTLFLISMMAPMSLLSGSYSMDILNSPDANSDIMTVVIVDNGIPSGRCYLDIYRLNESDKYIFEKIDTITLKESGKNSSTYINGVKKNEIYYLSINTTSLPPDDYLIHAESTFNVNENFDIFERKKQDDLTFRISAKNSSVRSY